jgi:hypothetical protein
MVSGEIHPAHDARDEVVLTGQIQQEAGLRHGRGRLDQDRAAHSGPAELRRQIRG